MDTNSVFIPTTIQECLLLTSDPDGKSCFAQLANSLLCTDSVQQIYTKMYQSSGSVFVEIHSIYLSFIIISHFSSVLNLYLKNDLKATEPKRGIY